MSRTLQACPCQGLRQVMLVLISRTKSCHDYTVCHQKLPREPKARTAMCSALWGDNVSFAPPPKFPANAMSSRAPGLLINHTSRAGQGGGTQTSPSPGKGGWARVDSPHLGEGAVTRFFCSFIPHTPRTPGLRREATAFGKTNKGRGERAGEAGPRATGRDEGGASQAHTGRARGGGDSPAAWSAVQRWPCPVSRPPAPTSLQPPVPPRCASPAWTIHEAPKPYEP